MSTLTQPLKQDLSKIASLQTDLDRLMNGSLRPREVVGGGYKNGKQVAAQWLRKEMYNELNPTAKISQVNLPSSGQGFSSIARAKASKAYKALLNDEYQLLNDAAVTNYGVIETPDDSDKYMIFVNY